MSRLSFKHTVLSCYFAYISSAAANNIASLLFIIFQNEFGLTTIQLASLVSFNFITQIFIDLIGAKYCDKIGYRVTAVIAASFLIAGLVSIGVLPCILENKYAALCIASMIAAIGSGLCEVIISPMVEAVPGEEKEAAMSILHSFYCWGHVGVIVISTLYFQIVGTDLWYILPVIWAIVPTLTLILFLFVPIRMLNESRQSMSISKLFKNKLFWIFILLMLCGGAAEQGMSQWASLFAEAALGVSKTVGNLLGPCFFAIMMGISRTLYGKYSEKLPMTKAIALCAVITILGYVMVALIPNAYIALLGCGIIGFGVGLFWPGILSVASKGIPAGGTAMFAILALFGDFGCALGPQSAATVAEIFGGDLSVGLLFCIIFPLIIAVTSFFYIKSEKDRNDQDQ